MSQKGQISGPDVSGLEHVPLPAVACDKKGLIHWANDHFIRMIDPVKILPEMSLFELAETTLGQLQLDRPDADNEVPSTVVIKGNQCTMYIGPAGGLIGCVFVPKKRDKSTKSAPSEPGDEITPQASAEAFPTGKKLLEAFISLSREVHLNMVEEELVQLFIHTCEDLFPGRLLCVRLFDQNSKGVVQVYSNGKLRDDRRDVVELTEKACAKYGLTGETATELFAERNVVTVDAYEPVFVESFGGFDIPLYDGIVFYGVLNFEYTKDDFVPGVGRFIAVPLASLICASIRNSRLMAETALLKDYLEKLLDRANAPVIAADQRRRITIVNQAFERQTAYDRKDILKTDLLSLIPEAEQVRMLPVVLAAMRGEPTSNFEVRIPRADGKGVAHIAFNTATILSQSGELEGVIYIGQDLTEIRALQNQVIHSEKLAALGQIAVGVAHELNNPLTSITVYASYLAKKLDGQIEESDVAKIRRIMDAAGRIQSFSRDLVAYARPYREEPILIKPSELLERALSFCEHLVEASKADVILDVAGKLEPIYGIRGQLEQVFVNLLTNACHALPEDGGTINITAYAIDKDKIEILLQDTGHGITEDHLSEVFEPFFTTKAEGQGTGLGLSIVRNILVNHNGAIKVESNVGEGTTFTITMFTR
ncbi:MAG: PAS domain-containing protein [Proteobacteria bacterium]|nr:PAS domain-containing protein [Pseudomonadota bacterium]